MFQRLLAASALSLVLTGFAGAAPSEANPGPRGRGERGIEHFVARLEKELTLTPEQSSQLREILRKDSLVPPPRFRQSPEQAERFGGPVPQEFLTQLRSKTVDTAALNREMEQRLAVQKTRHAQRLAVFVKIHDLLTPEQRAKLADHLEKRAGKRGPRRNEDSEKRGEDCG